MAPLRVGARTGLHRTLVAGLALQVVALGALTFHDADWTELTSVSFVMAVQALSGVAKDLTKMSSKSAVKYVAGSGDGTLFRLVAVLTGSKNALKGLGIIARSGSDPESKAARTWALALTAVCGVLVVVVAGWSLATTVVVGLVVYGIVFAVNSSLHSYLILAYSQGPADGRDRARSGR